MSRNNSCRPAERLRILAIAILVCGPSQTTAAQSPAPEPKIETHTLEELVADVLQGNPELAFYKARITEALGEMRSAGAFANPDFATTLGQKRVTAGPLLSDGLVWSVSAQQTFEWPGRISLRKAIANQQVKLAELGLEQFRGALASRARVLAFNLFAAQEKAGAASEVAERFRALREVLVQRDPAGLTPILESRIIEATEMTLQRKATEAALAEQSARLELNQLRGEPWDHPLRLQPPTLVFPPSADSETLLAAARANNFELRMRQVELEQQGLRVSLARNETRPSITVGPYVSQERAGDKETQVGISLSVPLPLWNKNGGRIASEEARRLQAETLLQVAVRNLERQVIEKALAYQTRVGEMNKWRPDSVRQFKEAAALADRHYRLGAVPISTYVELQKQYLEAVEALLSTRQEALEAAQELERLTGVAIDQFESIRPREQK